MSRVRHLNRLIVFVVLFLLASYLPANPLRHMPAHHTQPKPVIRARSPLPVDVNSYSRTLQLLQIDAQRRSARKHLGRLQREVATWAGEHPYTNSYDERIYALNAGYLAQGIGDILARQLHEARTVQAMGDVLQQIVNTRLHWRVFQKNLDDEQPYDAVHAADLELVQAHHLQEQQVIVVSLAEQALRVYGDGTLQQAYQVTTGRPELPSLPGAWPILERRTNVLFLSGEPRDSPYWFEPTPIKYSILYHQGGYFLHDAPWRASFGPGTQFPHEDAGGNTPANSTGSHGCINLAPDNAAWLYEHTDEHTVILVY